MWVTALAVLPDGELVSASADHTVCVWKDGTRLFRLVGHSDPILVLAADGKLASGSADNTVCVWENDVFVYSRRPHRPSEFSSCVA